MVQTSLGLVFTPETEVAIFWVPDSVSGVENQLVVSSIVGHPVEDLSPEFWANKQVILFMST